MKFLLVSFGVGSFTAVFLSVGKNSRGFNSRRHYAASPISPQWLFKIVEGGGAVAGVELGNVNSVPLLFLHEFDSLLQTLDPPVHLRDHLQRVVLDLTFRTGG